MVAKAIVQDGGIFIPGIGKIFGVHHGQITVNITLIKTQTDEDDPFVKAAGILRGRSVEPMQFEREMRDEWNRTTVD